MTRGSLNQTQGKRDQKASEYQTRRGRDCLHQCLPMNTATQIPMATGRREESHQSSKNAPGSCSFGVRC
jgi:hypothetical protein